MSTTKPDTTVAISRITHRGLFKDYVRMDKELANHVRNSSEARASGQHESAGFFAAAAAITRNNLLDLHIKLRKSEKALNGDV